MKMMILESFAGNGSFIKMANKKYSSTQLAKISELRTKLDMGDASQEEIAAMAKKLGLKASSTAVKSKRWLKAARFLILTKKC
jgi:DNA-binding GntR family transcriptional regulator